MKTFIAVNNGYVGPGVVSQLRKTYPEAELMGFDTGVFANNLTNTSFLPEVNMDHQIFEDVRNFDPEILNEIDAVV